METDVTFDIMSYRPEGDKKNSNFFDEYRLKIYERRAASGLDHMLGNLRALVVHLEQGDAFDYLREIYLMTPYRFTAGYVSDTHRVYVLTSRPEFPRLILLEPLQIDFEDDIKRLNMMYPLARHKPNARYVGEIFHTSDMQQTRDVLESHNIRFHYPGEVENRFFANEHFYFTFPSDFTYNRIGYTSFEMDDYDALGIGDRFELGGEQHAALQAQEELGRDRGVSELLTGVDH
ncbi:MAG: hypothetical protein AAF961_16130, partial [Planctomycetota bacterium]